MVASALGMRGNLGIEQVQVRGKPDPGSVEPVGARQYRGETSAVNR